MGLKSFHVRYYSFLLLYTKYEFILLQYSFKLKTSYSRMQQCNLLNALKRFRNVMQANSFFYLVILCTMMAGAVPCYQRHADAYIGKWMESHLFLQSNISGLFSLFFLVVSSGLEILHYLGVCLCDGNDQSMASFSISDRYGRHISLQTPTPCFKNSTTLLWFHNNLHKIAYIKYSWDLYLQMNFYWCSNKTFYYLCNYKIKELELFSRKIFEKISIFPIVHFINMRKSYY